MSQVQVTYNGDDYCTALSTTNGKMLALDCPGTKGNEFSPGSLVAAGLAGCMLISMAKLAERRGLDVSGASLGVDMSIVDQPEKRIGTIDITIQLPRGYSIADRKALEKAAGACPFKHSFRPDTEISTHFRYPTAGATAE